MNSKREIKRMMPLVKKINSYRVAYMSMTDEQLKEKATELKNRYPDEGDVGLLPEAFALVKEASRRAINKEHYDVQLLSGITLFKGRISEAKTGEGKTITIYLPAFLASLSGNGVHVVTVNDYLAKRDADEAAKVFEMLGVTVGCVLGGTDREDRKEAYRCDITYVTNSELGFDYLRDHIAMSRDGVVLRGLNYAIVDEVDSVLIDDAKIPLIISGPGDTAEDTLQKADAFVRTLEKGRLKEASAADKLFGATDHESNDFIKDEKQKHVYLTDSGNAKLEKFFGMSDMYGSTEGLNIQRAVNNALRAHYVMAKDHDYLVKDGKVELISQQTGRVSVGRRFADGLHQAIEVKEGVDVQRENTTIASVTYQSFFNLYNKKAGLTGTAMTSDKEFKDVYKLDVIEIPTNKPVIRNDHDDLVFRTKKEKWAAVCQEVLKTNKTGQPILVGTSSIEDSEILSALLTKNGIAHSVLNAKNEAIEAEIIAQAGQFGAVTVATNMAGRGTDIILDEKARAAGGLKVIGTERHESRRIDNQLKGRSGRQGDPGSSQFFISMEDRVLAVFGERMDALMAMSVPYGEPLYHPSLTKMVERAQKAVENENRLRRENMLKYDYANNEFREQIYAQINTIMFDDNPRQILQDIFDDLTDEIIDNHIPDGAKPETWDMESLVNEFFEKVAYVNIQMNIDGMTKDDLKQSFRNMNKALIDMKEKQIGDPALALSVECATMLRFTNTNWSKFLSSMEYIRSNIGNQAIAQRDPALEYKKRGVDLFNTMIGDIQKDIAMNFMRCRVTSQSIPSLRREVQERVAAEMRAAIEENENGGENTPDQDVKETV